MISSPGLAAGRSAVVHYQTMNNESTKHAKASQQDTILPFETATVLPTTSFLGVFKMSLTSGPRLHPTKQFISEGEHDKFMSPSIISL